MSSTPVIASAAGTWTLGDRTINRLGFGAMRLPGRAAFGRGLVQNRYGVDVGRERNDALVRECGRRGVAFVPFFAIVGEGAEGGGVAAHTGDPDHLVENVAAGALRLTDAEVAALG